MLTNILYIFKSFNEIIPFQIFFCFQNSYKSFIKLIPFQNIYRKYKLSHKINSHRYIHNYINLYDLLVNLLYCYKI